MNEIAAEFILNTGYALQLPMVQMLAVSSGRGIPARGGGRGESGNAERPSIDG